jgi:hypothetical protein
MRIIIVALVLVVFLQGLAVPVRGNDCPNQRARGPRGFTGPAVVPFTVVQPDPSELPMFGLQVISQDVSFVGYPSGPSGTVSRGFAITPHDTFVTQKMASRAFTSPFTGQATNLYANVMYNTFFNGTIEISPVVIGNVTITLYKAVPSGPFTASLVTVSTTYVLGPTMGPLIDIALSDTRHSLSVAAGDRLVVLVTFYPHAFLGGQSAESGFWISGGFELV